MGNKSEPVTKKKNVKRAGEPKGDCLWGGRMLTRIRKDEGGGVYK
jgi:hypothetical protein